MLLALLAVITLYTVSLYACKRDSGELLRMLFTLSLGIFWFGILTYIAKKGGYGKEFIPILYGGGAIYRKLQYLRLTLGQLGYTVAVGRYLFPFLFMLVALHASNFIPTEHLKWYYLAASLLPIVSLVIYIPSVFETLIEPYEVRLRLSVTLSYSWIIAYLLVGWACLLKEQCSGLDCSRLQLGKDRESDLELKLVAGAAGDAGGEDLIPGAERHPYLRHRNPFD